MPRLRSIPLLRPASSSAAIAALVLAGCGGASSGGSGDHDPATLAPAGSVIYGTAVVRPDGKLRDDLAAAARKVGRTSDPGAAIVRALDKSFHDGRSYDKDVRPWLGKRVAVYASDVGKTPAWAVIVATTDASKALKEVSTGNQHPLRSGSYRGVSYKRDTHDNTLAGTIDGFLVLGSERGFDGAVDVSQGASALSRSSRYAEALLRIGSGTVGSLYVDLPRLLQQAITAHGGGASAGFLSLPLLSKLAPATFALRANAQQISIDATAPLPKGIGLPEVATALIGSLPGDAWGALGFGSIAGSVQIATLVSGNIATAVVEPAFQRATGLDLGNDVLSWLGDAALFVRGTSVTDIGGGLVLSSSDPAASARAVRKLGQSLARRRVPVQPTAGGFAVRFANSKGAQPIVVLARGSRVVAGLGIAGARELLAPKRRLDASAGYKTASAALGSDYQPSFLLLTDPMLALVHALGADTNPKFQRALPYLQAYTSVTAGTKRNADIQYARLVATLR
jgi:Protein of unknown function (DUF3352)